MNVVADVPALVNSIGILFDIIGVVVLFRYGLPSRVTGPPFYGAEAKSVLGNVYASEAFTKGKAAYHRNRRLALAGLALMIFGFTVQIASNFL